MRTAFMGLTSSRGVTASGTLPTRTRPRPTIFRSTNQADRNGTHLMGSVSLLRQDGFGSGWRVSTPDRACEVLRQTVRPLVARRLDS